MIEVRLVCNGCGLVGGEGGWNDPPAHVHRHKLEMHGWHCAINKMDFCPPCYKERLEKQMSEKENQKTAVDDHMKVIAERIDEMSAEEDKIDILMKTVAKIEQSLPSILTTGERVFQNQTVIAEAYQSWAGHMGTIAAKLETVATDEIAARQKWDDETHERDLRDTIALNLYRRHLEEADVHYSERSIDQLKNVADACFKAAEAFMSARKFSNR